MAEDSRLEANRKARQEKKQDYLRAIFDRHAARFRAAASAGAPALAREAHAAMDEVLERDRAASAQSAGIQCRKGCSHCCHGPVEIWPQEAGLLAGAARAAGLALDEARLERQGRYTEDTWRHQPAADRACVFLGADGACRVYESRPNACRKLLVLSDPALCEADKHPLKSVERWVSWEAEAMESAALEVLGRELMPRPLLAALRK